MPVATKKAPAKKAAPVIDTSGYVQKSKLKLPKTLAECADLLYQKRLDRLAQQAIVDAMELEERDLREWIILQLPKSQATGVSGKVANAKIEQKVVPQVKDWDKLYAYIKRTAGFDLLNRAVNKKAVEARWLAKKDVPGVEAFNTLAVSCTKVS